MLVVYMLVLFVVNLCPKGVQLHQEGMCWSQWSLLAHLHYRVGLYHLTIACVNTIVLVAMCRRRQNCVFNGLVAGL